MFFYAVEVGVFEINFVDGGNNWNARRPGVVKRFDGLWHDAFDRRDHQDDDIGHHGAAGAHRGKRRVAGGVEKDHFARFGLDVIGANVLGDSACFLRHHVCFSYGVEQFGLAVVNVAHDGDDRRAFGAAFFDDVVFPHLAKDVDAAQVDLFDFKAIFVGDNLNGVFIKALIDRGHHAERNQFADQFIGVDAQPVGDVGQGGGFVDFEDRQVSLPTLLIRRHLVFESFAFFAFPGPFAPAGASGWLLLAALLRAAAQVFFGLRGLAGFFLFLFEFLNFPSDDFFGISRRFAFNVGRRDWFFVFDDFFASNFGRFYNDFRRNAGLKFGFEGNGSQFLFFLSRVFFLFGRLLVVFFREFFLRRN